MGRKRYTEAFKVETVKWYLDNPKGLKRVRSGAYHNWIKTNYNQRGGA